MKGKKSTIRQPVEPASFYKKQEKDEGFQRLRKNLQDEGLTPKDNPGEKDFKKVFPEDTKVEPVKPEKPARAKKKAELYPLETKINKYGFLHFKKELMQDLGLELKKEHKVIVERTEDGVKIRVA